MALQLSQPRTNARHEGRASRAHRLGYRPALMSVPCDQSNTTPRYSSERFKEAPPNSFLDQACRFEDSKRPFK